MLCAMDSNAFLFLVEKQYSANIFCIYYILVNFGNISMKYSRKLGCFYFANIERILEKNCHCVTNISNVS